MIRFAREYDALSILQQAVAKLGPALKRRRQAGSLMSETGKVPQPVGKIGPAEFVQELIAQILHALTESLKSELPTIEEIEAELQSELGDEGNVP